MIFVHSAQVREIVFNQNRQLKQTAIEKTLLSNHDQII